MWERASTRTRVLSCIGGLLVVLVVLFTHMHLKHHVSHVYTSPLIHVRVCIYLYIHTIHTVQYNTIQYNTIQYNTIQYNTIQYNTIQYNNIQYNTIQYNTIQSNALH